MDHRSRSMDSSLLRSAMTSHLKHGLYRKTKNRFGIGHVALEAQKGLWIASTLPHQSNDLHTCEVSQSNQGL